MARKLRVQYPGAIDHVLNRGDRREPIFRDDPDRLRFLETLAEACAKTEWRVHAGCLMGNHFHLVEVDCGASPDGRVDIVEQPALLGTPGEPMKGHSNVIILEPVYDCRIEE